MQSFSLGSNSAMWCWHWQIFTPKKQPKQKLFLETSFSFPNEVHWTNLSYSEWGSFTHTSTLYVNIQIQEYGSVCFWLQAWLVLPFFLPPYVIWNFCNTNIHHCNRIYLKKRVISDNWTEKSVKLFSFLVQIHFFYQAALRTRTYRPQPVTHTYFKLWSNYQVKPEVNSLILITLQAAISQGVWFRRWPTTYSFDLWNSKGLQILPLEEPTTW